MKSVKILLTEIIVKLFSPIICRIIVNQLNEDNDRFGVKSEIMNIINNEVRIWGDVRRLKIASTARMVNTLFNTSSGHIEVGDYTFTGHNVSIITGTHRYQSINGNRMTDIPDSGNDIIIGKGVWICSNAIILGPCKIGDNAVIAAGAVVNRDVAANTIVAGVPAKPIRNII